MAVTLRYCQAFSAHKEEEEPMAKKKRIQYKLKTKRVKVNRVRANRKYKDTVFRMLFSDKKHLLSLYNAVSGKSYTDPEQLQKILAPKFLFFYNGTEELVDSRTEYLSEGFENLTGDPDLELKVLTLNINKGHNLELMEQCRVLKEYAQYVERVRRYAGKMGLDAAIHRAVDECIQEGILEEFLRQRRAEVEAVSILEYDKEEEERKLREAEYEAGEAAGRESGRREGEQAMAEFIEKLMMADRMDDMKRAIKDKEYRVQLMRELSGSPNNILE